ncbi:MAG: hypothetical protein ACRDPC_16365 [Solirubrobacteraceae bacterium]
MRDRGVNRSSAGRVAWPPVFTRGRPGAGKDVRKRLLGTTRRREDRRQVTYDGRPLYHYVDDAPGRGWREPAAGGLRQCCWRPERPPPPPSRARATRPP